MGRLLYYILVPLFGLIIVIAVLISLWRKHKNSVARRIPLLRRTPPPSPTISKPIQLYEIISRGQFSYVWRAQYEHKIVAVKVILPHERCSFETERKMYSDYRLRHKNVLNFHSAEKRSEDGAIQYWIITEYHYLGSLADYLHSAILDYNSLMKLLLSMVEGLTYLHMEDETITPAKPVIVHRDFKSRNVLVKKDLTCCISDFGSACAFSSRSENDEAKSQVQYLLLVFLMICVYTYVYIQQVQYLLLVFLMICVYTYVYIHACVSIYI